MSFKDMVAADFQEVFLNTDEFAEKRVIRYDGVTYDGPDHEGVPVVLSGRGNRKRPRRESDHTQGLYLVTNTLRCALCDLGGNQPEPDQTLEISEPGSGPGVRRNVAGRIGGD